MQVCITSKRAWMLGNANSGLPSMLNNDLYLDPRRRGRLEAGNPGCPLRERAASSSLSPGVNILRELRRKIGVLSIKKLKNDK